MNTAGYHWCDNCNDAAFGARCQTCHQPARFVPAGKTLPSVEASAVEEIHEMEPPPAEPAPVRIAPGRANILFQEMRNALPK